MNSDRGLSGLLSKNTMNSFHGEPLPSSLKPDTRLKSGTSSNILFFPATAALEKALPTLDRAPLCHQQQRKRERSIPTTPSKAELFTVRNTSPVWPMAKMYDVSDLQKETDSLLASMSLDFPVIAWPFSDSDHDEDDPTAPGGMLSSSSSSSIDKDTPSVIDGLDTGRSSKRRRFRKFNNRLRLEAMTKTTTNQHNNTPHSLLRSPSFWSNLTLLLDETSSFTDS